MSNTNVTIYFAKDGRIFMSVDSNGRQRKLKDGNLIKGTLFRYYHKGAAIIVHRASADCNVFEIRDTLYRLMQTKIWSIPEQKTFTIDYAPADKIKRITYSNRIDTISEETHVEVKDDGSVSSSTAFRMVTRSQTLIHGHLFNCVHFFCWPPRKIRGKLTSNSEADETNEITKIYIKCRLNGII